MDVEGVLNNEPRLAGNRGEVIPTIQQLEMQISGSVSRTCTVCEVGGNCDLGVRR
jgi:hypothetical protein